MLYSNDVALVQLTLVVFFSVCVDAFVTSVLWICRCFISYYVDVGSSNINIHTLVTK